MSDELPPNWALTNIGTLGRYINGRGFGKAEWKKTGLPIIRIQNLNDETAEFNYSDKEHEQKYRVSDGDLLVAWAASLGVYNWNRGQGWLNQHIFRVEVEERAVTKPFLYYALKHALEALYKKAHGSGMVHVTKGKFDSHPVNLPPLNEQKRIVSKIDELFSRIDEGERALERVQKLVERYHQSVLKAAVTGELTRTWREKQAKSGGPIETGEALLARILTARRGAWEQAELEKMKAKGIKPKDDKCKQRYKEPTLPDTAELPELPDGWVWASLEQLAAPEKNAITDGPFGSNLKTDHYTDDGPRVVRLQNIKDGVFADVKAHISAERFEQLGKHRVLAGDLLIAALGESLPRACIAPDSLGPAIVKADCIRLKPSPYMPPSCIVAFLNSPPSRKRTKTIIHGVGRPRLNLDEIRSLKVPVPPHAEQEAIVDALDEQISSAEHLRLEAICGLAQLRALRQSILAQAFAGTLVPQDSTDEPASALLERIFADHTAKPATPSRSPKNKKKASK